MSHNSGDDIQRIAASEELPVEVEELVISNLITIGYYWTGSQNHLCSYSVYSMLNQVEGMTLCCIKKLDDFYHDWKTVFPDKINDASKVKIPEKYSSKKMMLLWTASQIIMNLIANGEFEVAYANLMEITQQWPDLYVNVVGILRKDKCKNMFSQWLMTHALFAFDINGKSEMESAGYRIEKI